MLFLLMITDVAALAFTDSGNTAAACRVVVFLVVVVVIVIRKDREKCAVKRVEILLHWKHPVEVVIKDAKMFLLTQKENRNREVHQRLSKPASVSVACRVGKIRRSHLRQQLKGIPHNGAQSAEGRQRAASAGKIW